MKRITQASVFAALAFGSLFIGMPASSAFAYDPPWPAGIPWPTAMPWPTAHPLQLGVPWSPSIQTNSVPAPVPLPPVVAAPAPLPPVVAAPVPLPPVVSAPAPLPPVVSAPAPLPPVVSASIVPVATPLPPVMPAVTNYSPPLPPVVSPSNVSVPQPPAVSLSNSAASVGGSSRSDAFEPGDAWRTLGAGASAWYRIGTGGMRMEVWLDAAPHTGVGMAIYAPDGSDRPVGHGTPDKADPTRSLWSGGHWNGDGNWYALITNSNPFAAQYRLTSAQQDISNKTCWSYWEYIGPNQVYWTKCSN